MKKKKFDLMHGLNNNTNQVQKMPMFMKALKIYYTVCSQKLVHQFSIISL